MSEWILEGIAASPGIGIGRAFLYAPTAAAEPDSARGEEEPITEAAVEEQLARLQEAKTAVMAALNGILERSGHRFDEKQGAIIAGHKGLLEDPAFTGDMAKLIRKGLVKAERAVRTVTGKYVALFESMDKEYMRERAQDIQDVGSRLLDQLRGTVRRSLADLEAGTILIAHDITPSDAMDIDPEKVQGFVTRIGGKTSHTAILARALGIPALVGVGQAMERIREGASLILDGVTGMCIVEPLPGTADAYAGRRSELLEEKRRLASLSHVEARSVDGAAFELAANAGSAAESHAAFTSGAKGIGLFRTEFLYMNSPQLPDEEEQFAVYRGLAEMWKGKPVIIRTLDIGGDKALPYLPLPPEENPFLGYRAIRIGLNEPEVLRVQLRAILRASAHGTLRIMFPMISSLGEWRQARSHVRGIMEELDREGTAYDASIQLGIMAEIPSVIQMADLFAKEVDFFSIGTNDLVQYTLAVDRMNEKVAYLYDYFHPAVVRSVRHLIQAAHREGKWVGMCGGMASDPLAVPLLVGCGLDEWSMEPPAVNRVKETMLRISRAECERWVDGILQLSTPEEIRAASVAFLAGRSA